MFNFIAQIIDGDVMVVQRCGSCNYGGPALFNLYNLSKAWQEGDWWFAAAYADADSDDADNSDDGDDATGSVLGWAAMRPAWGGTNFTNYTAPNAPLLSATIGLLDTWSPLIIVAAAAEAYVGQRLRLRLRDTPRLKRRTPRFAPRWSLEVRRTWDERTLGVRGDGAIMAGTVPPSRTSRRRYTRRRSSSATTTRTCSSSGSCDDWGAGDVALARSLSRFHVSPR